MSELTTIEVADPVPLAGALFEQCFGSPMPDFPRHFILQARLAESAPLSLGYVHFTKVDNFYLGGGMCIDTRAFRKLPRSARTQLARRGGAAFSMLSAAVARLDDCDAVFGYVGNRLAYRIDLAAGFEQTRYKHLIVYWKTPLDAAERVRIVEAANRCGPF
ncbi:MAG: hypothetical protein RQ741_10235 [Wenzhouxiangellaceae bacterium]|nr:hypothetical protein [Wenzhouxiangellaceae bacterium]